VTCVRKDLNKNLLPVFYYREYPFKKKKKFACIIFVNHHEKCNILRVFNFVNLAKIHKKGETCMLTNKLIDKSRHFLNNNVDSELSFTCHILDYYGEYI